MALLLCFRRIIKEVEIKLLTKMLADSNTEVETLQEALVQAQDELAVSVAFHLGYIELALITLLFVTSETKTTCHSKESWSMGWSSHSIRCRASISQNSASLYVLKSFLLFNCWCPKQILSRNCLVIALFATAGPSSPMCCRLSLLTM